jgi:hypothetical protein
MRLTNSAWLVANPLFDAGRHSSLFDYRFTFFDALDPLIGKTVPVFLALDGTGPSGSHFQLLAGTQQPNAFFDQTIDADGNGAFERTFSIGNFTYVPAFDEGGFALSIPGGSLSGSDSPIGHPRHDLDARKRERSGTGNAISGGHSVRRTWRAAAQISVRTS